MRAWSSRSASDSRGSISKRSSSSAISARTSSSGTAAAARCSAPGASASTCGPSVAQQAVDVDADVAHAVHRVAEHGDLELCQRVTAAAARAHCVTAVANDSECQSSVTT